MRVPVRIANPATLDDFGPAYDALIDEGVRWAILPRSLADKLDLPSIVDETGFTPPHYAYVQIGDRRGVTHVQISDVAIEVVIGRLTLTSLALVIDPENDSLVEMEVLLL